MSDELWKEAEAQIEESGHCKGRTPIDAMTRLFGEHFGKEAAPFSISREGCTMRKETRPVEELQRIRFGITNKKPWCEGKPLIAVEAGEMTYLIDGRRRLNKAIRIGAPKLLDVLLIARK